MDTYQHLLSEFGRQFDFHLNIWRFDLLQVPNLMAEAVRNAVEAEIIILATHQRDNLPTMIERWFDAWIQQKHGQTAILIALFDFPSEPGVSFPLSDYLKNAANKAGVDFLQQQAQTGRAAGWPRFEPDR